MTRSCKSWVNTCQYGPTHIMWYAAAGHMFFGDSLLPRYAVGVRLVEFHAMYDMCAGEDYDA